MQAVLNKGFKNKRAECGVGLIEVLVALVIFALGVIGMAGLQLRTMSLTMDSTQRSYVVAKTQDIADRIRSNGIPAGEYLSTYNAAGDFCDLVVLQNCADSVDGETTGCTAGEMVAFDLYDAFCVGTDEHASDGSYEKQVAEWQVEITCEYPLAGVMTPTTECDEFGAEVIIETSWFARSADEDPSSANPNRDSMTLRFVP